MFLWGSTDHFGDITPGGFSSREVLAARIYGVVVSSEERPRMIDEVLHPMVRFMLIELVRIPRNYAGKTFRCPAFSDAVGLTANTNVSQSQLRVKEFKA